MAMYKNVSNAKVNWAKSCGLKMNSWTQLYTRYIMEYKRTTYFLGGGDDAIATNLTLVAEKVNSVIKSWPFVLKDYPLLVGYS